MKARITKQVLTCFLICSTCLFGWVSHVDALSKQDKEIFYKAVEAEARDGGYNEKLAVANVICNRVNNPAFPNTINKVINEKHTSKGKTYYQFCVVRNGSINKVTPTEETIKAVNDTLNGKWIISDKVTFFNIKGLNSYAKRNYNYWGSDKIHDFYY